MRGCKCGERGCVQACALALLTQTSGRAEEKKDSGPGEKGWPAWVAARIVEGFSAPFVLPYVLDILSEM